MSAAAARTLTVGAVVRAVVEEFPDITISKVRFLESEGLLTPTRTASGYRQFSDEDVDRLRFVLRAQRDRFWPLKVIKDSLDAMDRGLGSPADAPDPRPRAPRPAPDPAVPTVEHLIAPLTLRLTREELARSSDLEESAVADLVDNGLLRPGSDGLHSESDLQVAQAAAGLAAYGVQARHLRSFRTAADREVGLVEQALGPRRGSDGDQHAAEVAHLCLTLHAALVRSGLARTTR